MSPDNPDRTLQAAKWPGSLLRRRLLHWT